jgi:uncharacterized membrane protein
MVFLRHEDQRQPIVRTKERADEMRRKLLRISAQQIVLVAAFMGLFVGAVLTSSLEAPHLLGLSGRVWKAAALCAFVLLVAFNVTKWRCPGCGRFLGGRNHYSLQCRTCGLSLRWWSKS